MDALDDDFAEMLLQAEAGYDMAMAARQERAQKSQQTPGGKPLIGERRGMAG